MNNLGEYLKKNGIRLGALVLAVVLVSGLVSAKSEGGTTEAKDAAEALAMPANKAATGVIGWLEGIYSYMFKHDSLIEENEELKIQVAELEAKLREADEALAENEDYRRLLGLREKHRDFVYEAVRVVDRGASNWNSTLTISKGEESGIEIGDCVADSSHNLVGQVTEVGTGWATVRTTIDTDMRVGVLVGEGGSAAMIVGNYELMKKGMTKLTYLTDESQVFEGDVLLTSGKGGSFPSGIVVGKVVEIKSEAGGQVEYATVSPSVDPDSLSRVFVIKDFTVIE